MLGYVRGAGRGEADDLLSALARRLVAADWPLAAAVQANPAARPGARCAMELHVFAPGRQEVLTISQDLGPMAQGCRLDPGALEAAVALMAAALEDGPRLMIVNKFGKQEAEGRGFRDLIGRAIGAGVPVLTAVSAGHLDAFEAYAEGLAEPLPPDAARIEAWCRAAASEGAA